MTPTEKKAREIYERFLPYVDSNDFIKDCFSEEWQKRNAKQCALICVDEIIKSLEKGLLIYQKEVYEWQIIQLEWHREVKTHIEKL